MAVAKYFNADWVLKHLIRKDEVTMEDLSFHATYASNTRMPNKARKFFCYNYYYFS